MAFYIRGSESSIFVPFGVNKSLMLYEGEVPLSVQGISMYRLSYIARGRGMLK
jgi:hypothetical protein